ncbi:MAG: CDP-glucose 4,6-dehydratase [Ignavibacteria bacterium GWA2_35_9]|nr:MAG: CDP-glucose 4,6-dehydratase [Ignavibacteria bacterium GWA2_35_9]OGU43942.1 MAG: CDP-glucose 4,6-dehydratase [Ignavibacteria bacterium GWB2_36_8]OGU53751.1 MAG: CDP-glucose 4,6-dehydratase [Ignavibacteria bacterium GWC2_36_12]
MKNLFGGVYKNKKVVITGDTGFKGSWLAIWLKELGADVYGYALPPKREKDNFVTTRLNEIIHHEDGDIRDKKHLLDFFKTIKPEIAFHLAAQPLVIDSYNDPHYTFETNLMGTVNFFEAVRETKSVKVAVNITSDKCYQNNEWNMGYKETDAMGGKDPYSASKGCSELITHSYLNSFFLKEGSANVASARAGNVIGGGDWAENRIVPDFFRAIKNGATLFLRYPDATRPWQHVLEPLGGYLLLASKLFSEGKKFQGGWNFGPRDQDNFSVKDLIANIINKSGTGVYDIDKVNEKVQEAGLLKLDIAKAQNYLGWNPVLDFDETVKMTVYGYTDENSHDNLYEKRVKQINEYLSIAAIKNIAWVENG